MTNEDFSWLENFDCTDCHQNTFLKKEYYMLHDEVWCSVASKFEMLCISCLEQRLNRTLNSNDFVFQPINYGSLFPQSKLLYSRLHSLNTGLIQNVWCNNWFIFSINDNTYSLYIYVERVNVLWYLDFSLLLLLFFFLIFYFLKINFFIAHLKNFFL